MDGHQLDGGAAVVAVTLAHAGGAIEEFFQPLLREIFRARRAALTNFLQILQAVLLIGILCRQPRGGERRLDGSHGIRDRADLQNTGVEGSSPVRVFFP